MAKIKTGSGSRKSARTAGAMTAEKAAKPYADVRDKGGMKLVRARYIGHDDGPHCWLVYGVMDTVGAVQISQMRTAGTLFAAFSKGYLVGKRKRLEDAIAVLLDDKQRQLFKGA